MRLWKTTGLYLINRLSTKIFEKVVNSQLEIHLSEHKLHEERQSAYRQFHSTESALLCVQNGILRSLNLNEATVLVILDLSAAFDTIDHSSFLCRLEQHFLIVDKPLQWMKSYLCERHIKLSASMVNYQNLYVLYFLCHKGPFLVRWITSFTPNLLVRSVESVNFNIISTLTIRTCTWY